MKLALIGIAGYGEFYLGHLLQAAGSGIELVGAVDIAPERCSRLADLRRLGCPIFPTMDALYEATRVDLAVIATPIHLHAPQTCRALAGGSSVLCEKPLAGSLADAANMQDAEEKSNGFVAIGYQWSFTRPIQDLKRDIIAGVLGRPIRLKSIVHYPRGVSYFRRNNWAGRLRTPAGQAVLDSPANNATAHFLHNMLYLLGERVDTSCSPKKVQTELFRGNEIDNYDTAAFRVQTESDVEVLFYTSQCVPKRQEPICHFEFERAVVEFDGAGSARLVARFADGRQHDYGQIAHTADKLWHSIDCVRQGTTPCCGITASMAHLRTIISAQRPRDEIRTFPEELRQCLQAGDDRIICINGLDEGLMECFRRNALPSELRLPWSEGMARKSATRRGPLSRPAVGV